MNSKVQISARQFSVLFFLIIIVDAKLQGLMMDELRQDYLISAIIGFILSFGIVYIYWLLLKRTGFSNPDKVFEKVTGKIIAKFILGIYAIYFLFLAMQDLRDITEMVRQYYIPNAPIQFIALPMMIAILYGLFKGIEVIARTSRYIFVSILASFVLFITFILIFNRPNLDHLVPLFQGDIKEIILKGVQDSYSIPYGISFIMFFIAPLVSDKRNILKQGFFGKLLGGLILVSTILVAILIINPMIIPTSLSPAMIITRRIDEPGFLQRLDLLTLCLFALSSLVKNSLLLYGAYSCVNGIVKIKIGARPFVYMLFGIIVLAFANSLFIHYSFALEFIKKYVTTYIHLTFELFLPLVLLLLTFIVKPKVEKEMVDN